MANKLGSLCSIAVLKMGAEGSLIVKDKHLGEVAPIRAALAIDTTGAGDLWAAGFLYGWLSGRPMEQCGRYGSLLGSEVVQIIGASMDAQQWASIKHKLSVTATSL